jgi:CheY-like chemotaxis protein
VFWPRAAVGHSPEGTPIQPPASGETILLVDDEPGVRGFCQKVLQESGYAVLGAGSAEEAFQQAERHSDRIDLLLTDIELFSAYAGMTQVGLEENRRFCGG